MRRAALLPLTLAAGLLLVAGCTTTAGVTVIPAQPSDASFQTRNAFIFVDGKQRGMTPATVRIRRSFGATEVSLRTGPEFTILRKFEIEWSTTSNRRMVQFTFGNEDGIYDLTDLPTMKDGTYVIPYFSHRVQVEDREFSLVLIVED